MNQLKMPLIFLTTTCASDHFTGRSILILLKVCRLAAADDIFHGGVFEISLDRLNHVKKATQNLITN